MKKKISKLVAWYKRPNKGAIANFIETFVVVGSIAFVIRTFGYGLYQVPSGSMETTMLVGERFFADKLSIWFKPPQRGDIIAFNEPTYPYAQNKLHNWFQRYIWGPENWTKRVIGIPGDHVEGKVEDGCPVVYLNGQKLCEPYINKYPLIMIYKKSAFTEQDEYLKLSHCDIRSFDQQCSYADQPFYTIDPALIIPRVPLIQPHVASRDIKDVFDVYLAENEYWAMGDNRRGSWDSRAWGKLEGHQIHGKIIYRIWSMDSDDSWLLLDLIKHPISFWKKVRWNRCFQAVH